MRAHRAVDDAVRPVAFAVFAVQHRQAELHVDPVDADRGAGRGLRSGGPGAAAGALGVRGRGGPLVRRGKLLRADVGPVVRGRGRAHRVPVLDGRDVPGGSAGRCGDQRAGRAGRAGLRQVPRHDGRVLVPLPGAVRPRPPVPRPTGPGVFHGRVRRARTSRGRHKDVRRCRQRQFENIPRHQTFFARQ